MARVKPIALILLTLLDSRALAQEQEHGGQASGHLAVLPVEAGRSARNSESQRAEAEPVGRAEKWSVEPCVILTLTMPPLAGIRSDRFFTRYPLP
jgi:hypothetical protein